MRIVILTGAGISAESGLGTFRDKDGLWARHRIEDVATPEGFSANPVLVHDFYNTRRADCLAARPNAAHHALARLQKHHDVTLVTQNIDDLHERAGASGVIHMHGELLRALCNACGHRWGAPRMMWAADPCPVCTARATRPDVVWFGEIPYHMDRIDGALAKADLFVIIGSSGQVYPAAGYAHLASRLGMEVLEFNLASTGNDDIDVGHYGPASQTLPHWVDGMATSV